MKTELEMAERILEILTSREFHQRGKGKNPPKPGEDACNYFLKRIKNKVQVNQPIGFILGYGYCKNPNACDGRPEPDEAEKKSLEFLVGLKKIENIYPPGIIINLVTSGKRAEFVNGARIGDTLRYHQQLQEMIKKNIDFSRYFQLFKLEDIWEKYADKFYPLLQRKIEEVGAIINTDPDLERLKIQAERNILQNVNEETLVKAVVKFKASFETERELNMYERSFPGAIMMSYRPNPSYGVPCLLLWTIKKGCITQPWQGWYNENTGEIITQERQKRIIH